jgi:large subunit ribosomal protein L30
MSSNDTTTNTKTDAEEKKESTICVVRIRGAHGMNRKIQYTLHLFNLYSVNHATLVRSTPSVLGMLQKTKDYIAFGEVDVESIKKLLHKRALLTGSKPLTDEHVRQNTVYKTVDGLAKALYDGKISLKEVKDLKPVFRLHPPRGGFRGSIKKSIGAGGVLGNVKDKINVYLDRMV